MLGKTVYLDESQPWLGTTEVADSASWWSGLLNVVNKVSATAQKIAPEVKNISSQIAALRQQAGGSTYVPNYSTGTNAPVLPTQPKPAISGTKVALIIGGVAAVGIVTYAIVRHNKKKKLGEVFNNHARRMQSRKK